MLPAHSSERPGRSSAASARGAALVAMAWRQAIHTSARAITSAAKSAASGVVPADQPASNQNRPAPSASAQDTMRAAMRLQDAALAIDKYQRCHNRHRRERPIAKRGGKGAAEQYRRDEGFARHPGGAGIEKHMQGA